MLNNIEFGKRIGILRKNKNYAVECGKSYDIVWYKIKKFQKISANNKDKSVELKINGLYKKLESYPIYQSYLIMHDEIEEELFMIKEIFDKYFMDLLSLK